MSNELYEENGEVMDVEFLSKDGRDAEPTTTNRTPPAGKDEQEGDDETSSHSSNGAVSSEASGGTNGTGTTTSGGATDQLFAVKEDRNVQRSRILFLTVLLSFAAIAGGVTYWFTSSAQEQLFVDEVSLILSRL
jgi:hypothetical protein